MTDKPYDPSKAMLEKMVEDDAAFREADKDRFTDEQGAAALATAQAYADKHPSPHAARDRTEEYDMRPRPNPLYDLDMVEDESEGFEYECRDGKNLDEKAEQLMATEMTAHIGGITRRPTSMFDENDKARGPVGSYRSDDEPKHIAGPGPCVRGGPDYGKDIPWGDPDTWPSPPTPLPTVLSEKDREKLKDTIEKMGQGQDGGGYRMNAGKNQIELLPEIWLWAIADVMTQGARKYPARNWEKGMDWSAMIGCMYRHLAKFQSGQRYDGKEFNKKLGTTGCHELAMIAWNALALMFYDIYGLGNNDLPVYEDLDHFIRVNGSNSDLAVRWAKEDSNDNAPE